MKEELRITLTKVIKAPKWKILRVIARVEDFPKYVPSVKECQVIHRSKNKMRTRWCVLIDGIPISWVEEERFEFPAYRISFEALEGDMAELKGAWELHDHPGGARVEINVSFRPGIPGIGSFVDSYLKELVAKNFESILESIEKRLISVRYASYKRGELDKIAGFGVVTHLYNFNHLVRCMKMLDPGFKVPSREFLSKLFEMTPSFKLMDVNDFTSAAGQTVNGCLIMCTFIPDMLETHIGSVYSKVVRACRIAEKSGVGVVSLGGFSSIVGERYHREISSEVDIPVTTGNTYTAALAIDGVIKAAESLNVNLSDAHAAVVGGTGDIGSACARALCGSVKRLTITGRTKSNLVRLKRELSGYGKAKVEATTDNRKAVSDADVVITCASVCASILDINWFKPGAIICDVAYPKNVSYRPTSRRDIFIFSGGLTKLPMPLEIPFETGLPSAATTYGCFAEAMVLALEHRFESLSRGRGNITLEKMEEMRALGFKHGFGVSPFYWGERLIDENLIEEIKRNVCA